MQLAGFPSLELQLELGGERDLELDRNARVELSPEFDQDSREPFPNRKEVMDLGVTGGAQTQ
jgi:hypothetical protein